VALAVYSPHGGLHPDAAFGRNPQQGYVMVLRDFLPPALRGVMVAAFLAAAMQSDNPVLDGLARFFTDAAGAAQSVRTEVDTFMRQRLEKLVADMDFVPREEFEAVKAMASKARSENERLEARIAELEARLAPTQPVGGKPVS
jgi:hypothetical protein